MSIIQIFKNKNNDTIVVELVQKEDEYLSKKTCKDYELNPYHFKLLGRASVQNGFKHNIYYNNLINYWKDTNKYLKDKSLRLNVFKGINYTKDTNWQIKDNITWKKNCPLPKDEEFKRL